MYTYVTVADGVWYWPKHPAGFVHHAEGLLNLIQHGQTHDQKRAYLCMKFLVTLSNR